MLDPKLDNSDLNKHLLSDTVLLGYAVISTLMLLGWLLWYSRYGLDLTDEGYYLVWISDPFAYSTSVSQFGFIYHPFYKFLEGNIAALRQANVCITFVLGWYLSYVYLNKLFADRLLNNWQLLVISSGFATASLVEFDTWLLTPSYNSLALQALLIVAAGLLLAEKKPTRTSGSGWMLIGIGGWLAFMAKPSTAGALTLFVLAYLLAAKKFHVRSVLISVATAVGLLVVSALLIDGSINAFIARLKGGLEMMLLLGGDHSHSKLLRLDSFSFSGRARVILLLVTSSVLFTAYLLNSTSGWRIKLGTVLSSGPCLLIVLSVTGIVDRTPWLGGGHPGLLLLSIPISAVLFAGYVNRSGVFTRIPASKWALAFLLLVLPHVYAFGTNNNYWGVGSSAGIFWILSVFVLFAPATKKFPLLRVLVPFALSTQAVTVVLILHAMESPYRQPHPLRQNNYRIEIGGHSSTLILSEEYGRFITSATKSAENARFKARTPLIDLSGQSPGILYTLGAKSIGLPWLLGGYPGSELMAIDALAKVPCADLAASWLLVEPMGARKLPDEVLYSFGAKLQDYKVVGEWKMAVGVVGAVAGQPTKYSRLQQLLKPLRSQSVAYNACQNYR